MAFEVPQEKKEKTPTFEEWDREETAVDKENYPAGFLWTRVAGLFDDPDLVKALDGMTDEQIEALGNAGSSDMAEALRALKDVKSAAVDARAARRERYREKYPDHGP